MTIISDEQEHCRAEFGVEFLMDVLRIHYSGMGSTSHRHDNRSLVTDEDSLAIRAAIINAMKLYLMNDARKEEVDCILKFLTACKDSLLVSNSY